MILCLNGKNMNREELRGAIHSVQFVSAGRIRCPPANILRLPPEVKTTTERSAPVIAECI